MAGKKRKGAPSGPSKAVSPSSASGSGRTSGSGRFPKKKQRRKKSTRHATRPKQRPLLTGVLRVNARGMGQVETAEGVFVIPASHLAEAMHGDSVQIRPIGGSRGPRPLGAVVHVLERGCTTFAARFEQVGALRVLVALDDRLLHDFVVDPSDTSPERLGATDGSIVCARITRYPTRRDAGMATVERLVGEGEREDLAVESVIAAHDFALEFPADALEQADRLALDVEEALREPLRRDLRGRFAVTVDPPDARDFDDAVSLERLPGGGWLLGVHIADVSAYVPWDSPLDRAARSRATSVYLVDRVLPMLPEKLSCDLCSLRPNEDRLAMTVDLTLDARGRVTGSDVYPSVIRSKARLSYPEVDAMLAGGDSAARETGAPQGSPRTLPAFFAELDEVSRARQRLRRERGAIEFVTSEAKVELDEAHRPVGVHVRRPTPATMLVEEAMLAANEAVARMLSVSGIPAAFRVHEPPAADSCAALIPLLLELGCLDAPSKAGLANGDPHALQSVLDAVRGAPEEELVSTLLLRSMRRAEYSPSNNGHFGLGAAAYCHFTSPIRRYPDLVVHRSLKHLLARDLKPAQRRALEYEMPGICKHSSVMEREAAAAAYESQAAKLAEYMGGFVGQAFWGVVTSVHDFGAFVRLDETSATGLVRIRDLGGGWWTCNDARYELVNDDTGESVRLGQRIEVRVRSVDTLKGQVDFTLA